MEITILCKVVDNYGDIGVTFRLAKQLLKVFDGAIGVNLIVDDLSSFNQICNAVDVSKNVQIVEKINVYNWKSYNFCYDVFSKNDGEKLSVILECFQCGRPDWMEKILFDDKLNRTVQIIMIDYLTAEPYAETFHCLQSLTRSAKVKKVNFMPGFTEKTGGLIIDDVWENLPEYNKDGDVFIFTYEKNWKPLVCAMKKNQKVVGKNILVAQGRGMKSFLDAVSCESSEPYTPCDDKFIRQNLKITKLKYLNQVEWDELMKKCSILFIRGEESMSRACLSGIPFVWHAYPQSDEYQLVKVNALLDCMKQFFTSEDFEIVKRVWININKPENEVSEKELEDSFTLFLQNAEKLVYGYRDFALKLRKNGDLAHNLMTFITKICIM